MQGVWGQTAPFARQQGRGLRAFFKGGPYVAPPFPEKRMYDARRGFLAQYQVSNPGE
jgi:hypothetical protein